MRTRLLVAAVCILSVPFWFSASPEDKPLNSAPFATVAYAGHTIAGDWCACGGPGCICGPGGDPADQSGKPKADKAEVRLDQAASPVREHSHSGFDFGAGALMLALALFVWTRLRA